MTSRRADGAYGGASVRSFVMETLFVGGPCAQRELEIGSAELAGAPPAHQVPDVSSFVEGREGVAVRLAALADMAGVTDEARFVHVESADGDFTANVPLEDAVAGGLVLYGLAGEELPRKYGGPFRLLFVDTEECSVNVKFLGRIEFVREPGSHTARCAD